MKTKIGNWRELERKLNRCRDKGLTSYLFHNREWENGILRDVTGEIYDFEMYHYVYFIDHVCSREELIKGLAELSPFADDAFTLAQQMSEQDFSDFKLNLPFERLGEGGKMSAKYSSLLLPARLVLALFLAEKAATPLGVTLVRMLEVELGV